MFKRFAIIWAALRGDLRLFWRALRHPQSPGWLKWGAAALVLYALMPIDFIPDVIPGLGALDDIAVITLGLKWMLSRLPQSLRSQL